MTNYRIKENTQYNSREIYFEGKPADAVREALKALKMRWHSVKKCWYGYAAEWELIQAIQTSTPEESALDTAIVTDGYMGGGGYHGAKSGRHLYGKDLSAAIRADLKAAGVKNVFVRCESYSGGQHLYVTVKTTPEDIRPFEEYKQGYQIRPSDTWIYYTDNAGKSNCIHTDAYFVMTAEEQETIRNAAAKHTHETVTGKEFQLNHFCLDSYSEFSDTGMKKLQTIQNIITTYHYDESNSQADYFDTNFYYTIVTKPATTAA